MAKKMKRQPEPYNTVGVRFLGQNVGKVFTYGIRRGAKVLLGQELVADTPVGPGLCVVVRLDKKPQAVNPLWPEGLKFIVRKTTAL